MASQAAAAWRQLELGDSQGCVELGLEYAGNVSQVLGRVGSLLTGPQGTEAFQVGSGAQLHVLLVYQQQTALLGIASHLRATAVPIQLRPTRARVPPSAGVRHGWQRVP